MTVKFSRKNQEQLLEIAAKATNSTGWKDDAEALLVSVNNKPRAIIVFQGANVAGAEIHVASTTIPMRPTSDMVAAIRMYAGQVRGWPSLVAPIAAWNRPRRCLPSNSGPSPSASSPRRKPGAMLWCFTASTA